MWILYDQYNICMSSLSNLEPSFLSMPDFTPLSCPCMGPFLHLSLSLLYTIETAEREKEMWDWSKARRTPLWLVTKIGLFIWLLFDNFHFIPKSDIKRHLCFSPPLSMWFQYHCCIDFPFMELTHVLFFGLLWIIYMEKSKSYK